MTARERSGATVKRRRAAMTPEQRAWCKHYQQQTTFEPLMDNFLEGNESFLEAAKGSVRWFEDWSNDAHLSVMNIPGDDV